MSPIYPVRLLCIELLLSSFILSSFLHGFNAIKTEGVCFFPSYIYKMLGCSGFASLPIFYVAQMFGYPQFEFTVHTVHIFQCIQ
ncbi:hypothetical protein GDO78_016461 [Eleutherodactylus coqui]|uniref:Uncharacterized protein n=1 Tax=Eleutherodactylus coqui TaxID=57060 RepID=A0A8J6C8G7_ELECQ|nr:hypothetical protein GDO78_016461 [Eleutherodactylus coqui]